MINKNNETLESLQIKLELAKKLRTTKKNGSTIPDLDLPFNEFILECYLHSYPCSYGKYIEQKFIHDINKTKSYVNELSPKMNKGDFELDRPTYFYHEGMPVYYYNKEKFSFELKTSFLGKDDGYSVRNIKPYQEINGGYVICLVDCDNDFKEEIYVVDFADLKKSFTLTHMDGTADKHSEDGFKNLGLSFKKDSYTHMLLDRLSKMSGTSFNDFKEYVNKISEKIHNDFINSEQFKNYKIVHEEFYYLAASHQILFEKDREISYRGGEITDKDREIINEHKQIIDKQREIEKNILNKDHYMESVNNVMVKLSHKYDRIKSTHYNHRGPYTMFFEMIGLNKHREYFDRFYSDYQDELITQLKLNK
jgi:hypothetical protein